jgi:spore maturation protein CgeB
MDRYYADGKELVLFDGSADGLVANVKRYLAHDRERTRIAEAGYARTLREHTYDMRFAELFARAGLSLP